MANRKHRVFGLKWGRHLDGRVRWIWYVQCGQCSRVEHFVRWGSTLIWLEMHVPGLHR